MLWLKVSLFPTLVIIKIIVQQFKKKKQGKKMVIKKKTIQFWSNKLLKYG